MRLGLLLVVLLTLAIPAAAQQLAFKRVSEGGDERLSYRWRDAGRHERLVSFTLTHRAIRDAEASFAEFSLDAMWRIVERELRDEVERFGHGARIDVHRTPDGLRWTLEVRDAGRIEQLTRRVEQRVATSKQAYLARHLRRTVGSRRIQVDFAAATRALQDPLQAVAKALAGVPGLPDDDRARLALALGFFQQIPYAALEDQRRQGGDFLPGPALLAENRGDCDSKAVALAAVLRGFTHLRKLAVVTMPGHAILAVDMPAEAGDTTIRQGSRQYVALEPAGPALSRVGSVAADTAKYLAGAAREIEVWPIE
ncbi:MAG TPA: hypothetical protein VEC60_17250 [Reyranella sp.]|nr:hypothetical protein [Reyranella sp.]